MTERTLGPRIGTLNEKPLHAALKEWCREEGDRLEIPIDGFVVDIVRGNLLIEIQTGSTATLKRKLTALIKRHPVRLVLPIAARKTVTRIDTEGREIGSSLSPKRRHLIDVFHELINLRAFLGDSNLSVDIVLVHEEEVRRPREVRRRRRDWEVHERRLIEVLDCVSLHHPVDYLAFLPASLKEPFCTADLAQALHLPRSMARKIAYVLREMGALLSVGKKGNAILYARNIGTMAFSREEEME